MRKLSSGIVFILLLFIKPTPVYANMIWPSVYIAEGMRTWWIILAGLLIEYIFIKIFIKENYLKSLIITIVINFISTLIGIIAIPLIGIFGELILIPFDSIFNTTTFHLSHWIFAYILIILLNTSIEALSIKIIFKKIFRKVFLWLLIANIFSVILSVFVITSTVLI